MSVSLSYRRISENLNTSLENFDEVNQLLPTTDTDEHTELKARWQAVLSNGASLASYVKGHHRAQSPQVLENLEELAKFADVRRPFRLSVIGQKGVGKSALVNALLGASIAQYTPSEVAGKAVSGTRIRLVATADSEQVPWKVVFLTPSRLWEIGSHLLAVAQLPLPAAPSDLNSREQVLSVLSGAIQKEEVGQNLGAISSSTQIQAASAVQTIERLIAVFSATGFVPSTYQLEIRDEDVDGEISRYIRQTDDHLHLAVDYVERFIPENKAGFLAGRRLELEDVLGLDDPRDSFFALEAFRESFAVIFVFKCDRGLNTESSSLLKYLFSRDEEELSKFGSLADLNKAIIVANQFDSVISGVSADGGANPLKGIEDLRKELSRFTRQPVPVFLTSAQIGQTASQIQAEPDFRPSAAYQGYLPSLVNLMGWLDKAGKGLTPDYLDFVLSQRAEIEEAVSISDEDISARARLIYTLSGLPRLTKRVEEALEPGSILRGRVANAEYFYTAAVHATALAYARQMRQLNLKLEEINLPPVSFEARQFAKFQHEMRQKVEAVYGELKLGYFTLSQKYIHGPLPKEGEQLRQEFLETIRRSISANRGLIENAPHIATGETVTDARRKVFEDINDWLAIEAGRQFRGLVAPLLTELESIAANAQRRLTQLSLSAVDESFWKNFRARLAGLRQKLLNHAESLAISYYTDNRFSSYDLKITEALHMGEPARRREDIIRLLQDQVLSWYNNLWHLLAKVGMTELNLFVNQLRYYILGLEAEDSLLAEMEMGEVGQSSLPPADSLLSALNTRYHGDENYRRAYLTREPSPSEKLAAELREWLALILPPLDGGLELSRAWAMAATPLENSADEVDDSETVVVDSVGHPGVKSSVVAEVVTSPSNYSRLSNPIESRHPYGTTTRQVWEVTNPDPTATHTRVHFRRVELTGQGDKILLESFGKKEQQVITGQHYDLYSIPLLGRVITIRFSSENSTKPGWGFILDGVESYTPTPEEALSGK